MYKLKAKFQVRSSFSKVLIIKLKIPVLWVPVRGQLLYSALAHGTFADYTDFHDCPVANLLSHKTSMIVKFLLA